MKLCEGHVAVVTGAASGIGLAIAERLSERGLSVVLADVEEPALRTAEDRLRDSGASVLAVRTDVSDEGSVFDLADRTLERFGRVDLVCNNAGVTAPAAPMWETDERHWRWVLGVNLWGVIHGIRAFVPHLVAQGSGHVANTGSMAGLSIVPMVAPYTASKHAVVAISESLRAELDVHAPDVGVTVLCPSYVPTKLADSARNRPPELTPVGAPAATQERVRGNYPPMAASAVAAKLIAGIEAGRLHVTTHPGSIDRVRERVDHLVDDIDS
jgi:NAD(P)-dependent dehydrogenase (short-subunit alcohol dehydrogenase family)